MASGHPAHADPLIAALHQPARYPGVVGAVSLLETHISWVLLAGEFAYKIKKPVNFGFLDFSTLEARRTFCEAELRLNRRTAPDVYLDVLPIAGTRSAPIIGGPGEPIEYLLRMHRFPQEAIFDSMVKKGSLRRAHMEQLAARIAAFHLSLHATGNEASYGTSEQVRADAMQNFAQLRELGVHGESADLLGELAEWTEAEHARLAPAFEFRQHAGFVRECHGDLHLRNIVMIDDKPVPFDCIEFSDTLRWIDVINEVAFLVMDLMEHRKRGLAFVFLNAYLEATGDYAGVELLRFYVVYRAMVRAKIARMRMAQTGAKDSAEYHAYLELAHEAAGLAKGSAPDGALVLMHGLSGSGKSTLARELAGTFHALRLRSDVERKRLHKLAPLSRTGAEDDAGLYGKEANELTYDRLADLARLLLSEGYPVIVDAAFLDRRERLCFRELSRELKVPFAVVSCTEPDSLLRERVSRRAEQGGDASDAGLRVLELQLSRTIPPGDDESWEFLYVDAAALANGAPGKLVNLLHDRLGLTADPLPKS